MKTYLIGVFGVFVFVGMGLAQVVPTATQAQGGQTLTTPPKAEPAPVLSDVDGLRLKNGMLKLQNTQVTLDKLKAEFQGLLTSLQKPGYQIAQGADGKIGYVPEPKAEKDEPK